MRVVTGRCSTNLTTWSSCELNQLLIKPALASISLIALFFNSSFNLFAAIRSATVSGRSAAGWAAGILTVDAVGIYIFIVSSAFVAAFASRFLKESSTYILILPSSVGVSFLISFFVFFCVISSTLNMSAFFYSSSFFFLSSSCCCLNYYLFLWSWCLYFLSS